MIWFDMCKLRIFGYALDTLARQSQNNFALTSTYPYLCEHDERHTICFNCNSVLGCCVFG